MILPHAYTFWLYALLGLVALVLLVGCVPLHLAKVSSGRADGPLRDFSTYWGLSWGAFLLILSSAAWRFAEIDLAHAFVPQAQLVWHTALMQIGVWLVFGLVWMAWTTSCSRSKLVMSVWTLAWLPTGLVLWLTLSSAYSLGSWSNSPRMTGRELANLSLVPSLEELAFTGTVHQLLGVLVLGLAVWLLAGQRKAAGFAKWASWGPILLVCAGGFLFLFGDFQAWPLDDIKPLTDFEVFSKKLLGLALGLGGVALSALAHQDELRAERGQSILAGSALLAGAILLTSTQTSAPYSQEAKALYFYHHALALILAFGAGTKLIGLRSQEVSKSSHLLWCSSLAAVGILLLVSPWGGVF